MAFARGKITAGLLGLSLCGLAAVASSTGRAGSPLGCHKADDAKPSVVPMKAVESPATPVVALVPVASPPPVEIPPPTPPHPGPGIDLPKLPGVTPSPATEPVALPLPKIELTQAPAIPPVAVPAVKDPTPLVVPPVTSPLPPPAAVPQLVLPDPVSPKPAVQTPSVPDLAPLAPEPKPIPTAGTVPPAPATPPTPTSSGVKVVVTLSTGQPSLTVLVDGAEMLTVACEQLDLAARGPGDDSVSAIKASGKVKFNAPGCWGTCDELLINPKTWDGSMFKNVRVTCRQGSGETEVAAEKLAFRLRSGKEPLLSTVPAGHSAPARKD
jgi:hypothetical protein